MRRVSDELGRGIVAETDGRTTWINGLICMGRFCKTSWEVYVFVFEEEKEAGGLVEEPYDKSWRTWKNQMRNIHGVIVPDDFAPDFVKAS